jgi:hypothetical protein
MFLCRNSPTSKDSMRKSSQIPALMEESGPVIHSRLRLKVALGQPLLIYPIIVLVAYRDGENWPERIIEQNNIEEIKIVPDSIAKSCARFEFLRTIQTPSEIGTRRIWVDSRTNTIVMIMEVRDAAPLTIDSFMRGTRSS